MATAKTGRPVGRPRKGSKVDVATFPADRAEWSLTQWEAMLEAEGLGMSAGMLPASSLNLRETDRVSCLDCIGYHTYDMGCYYYDGGEG